MGIFPCPVFSQTRLLAYFGIVDNVHPHMIVFVLEVPPDHMTGQVTAYLRNHVTH
jgi:hypothetical protein